MGRGVGRADPPAPYCGYIGRIGDGGGNGKRPTPGGGGIMGRIPRTGGCSGKRGGLGGGKRGFLLMLFGLAGIC